MENTKHNKVANNENTNNANNTNNTNNNNNNKIKNKHYLMLCELHCPAIHGKTSSSDPNIECHFLVNDIFDPKTGVSLNSSTESDDPFNSIDENDEGNTITETIEFLKENYTNPVNFNSNYFENHPTIRNYHQIVLNPNYIKPEIGEYIMLPTQEAVTVLKTVWLRIIQRKWKKVFAERQEVIRNRCSLTAITDREIHGKWTQNCITMPGLQGMLCGLL
jgi:hypothetical protein